MDHVEGVSYLMGGRAASTTDRPPSILGDRDGVDTTHGPSERYSHCVPTQVYTPVEWNTMSVQHVKVVPLPPNITCSGATKNWRLELC